MSLDLNFTSIFVKFDRQGYVMGDWDGCGVLIIVVLGVLRLLDVAMSERIG